MCTGKPGATTKWACGQCNPCRINLRRIWTARLLLESTQHERTYFVTLTYSPEALPPGGTLVPRDLQLWLKRLRKRLAPVTFRFYAVGEYGDKTKRPHYHALIFLPDVPGFDQAVRETWPHGLTHIGIGSAESMTYVAGYTLKKLAWKDPVPGLTAEFSRMSLRPGIGAGAIPSLAKAINTAAIAAHIAETGDVPQTVRLAGAQLPIGRYVKTRLRDAAGYPATDPSYRLAHMLNQPLRTTEENKIRREQSRARGRKLYNSRIEKAKL